MLNLYADFYPLLCARHTILYANGEETVTRLIDKKIRELAILTNNYLAIVDCNKILLNCEYISQNAKAQERFIKELDNLCAFYSHPEIFFMQPSHSTFIDGCLNYVIQKKRFSRLDALSAIFSQRNMQPPRNFLGAFVFR